MPSELLSIGSLADAAGVSRRAVRFYVQRGLLPPPRGRGRGSRYTLEHLERLRRIQDLQAAGHSLEAIRRILDGRGDAPSGPRGSDRTVASRRTPITAELWTRVPLGEGVELHVDLSRHPLEAEQLLEIRERVQTALNEHR